MKCILAATLVCLPVAAFAGKAEGDSCAAGLSTPAMKIYKAVAPDVTPSSDLRSMVKSKTRGLVFSGEVQRAVARASAEEAGPCLKKLKN